MSDEISIPVFWPDDIADTLTPLTILKAQAVELGKRTRGMLRSDIITTTRPDGQIEHELQIEAPYLKYSYVLISISHDEYLVYPVIVSLSGIASDWRDLRFEGTMIEVDNEQEFLNLLEAILGATKTRSILQSLIARSREKKGYGPDAVAAATKY